MRFVLLLLMVPAPKGDPSPFAGSFEAKWGGLKWTAHFLEDGTYWSPEYGRGTWNRDDDVVTFSDDWLRNQETSWFTLVIDDWKTMDARGYGVREGLPSGEVKVRMRRLEPLPMPREVKP